MNRVLKYHIKDRIVLRIKQLKLLLFPSKPIVLIFTMGKVGSLSVYSSLKKKMWNHAVFHIHTLDCDEVIEQNRELNKRGLFPDSRNPIPLINKFLTKRKVKVITIVRNPIERNISAFFDAFEFMVGVNPKNYKGNMEELEYIYHETFYHQYPLKWFKKQLYNGIGIDVFKYPFNPDLGHLTIEEKTTSVLLLRSNLTDKLKEQLISEFFSIKDFRLTNTNVNSSNLYSEFKKNIKFPKEYLDTIYNSEMAIHFFSEQERKESIQKWIKQVI